MVAAAAEHGYAGATVARVVELAEVSRATFYQHFSSREDCFGAAYLHGLERFTRAVRAGASGSDPRRRPEAVLDALLAALDGDPAAARLILVEGLATPPALRREHEELIARVDGEIAGFLDSQPADGALQIPATALLGGVGEVLATRSLQGGLGDLPRLRQDLGRWLDAYRLPVGMRPLPQRHWQQLGSFARSVRPPAAAVPPLLPRGLSALPPVEAAAHRRERILRAAVRLIAEEGVAAASVARIASVARVPRAAFYSHFESREEALLAAQREGMQEALAAAAAAYGPKAPWPQRVLDSLRAFLAHVAEHPFRAQLEFVESYAAGRAATEHRQENRAVFALFLEEGYHQSPRGAALPRFCSEAIGAAVFALMRSRVVAGKTDRLLSLAPATGYTILAPFIGPQEAAAQVQAWSPGAR
jgi:AcrR family transcriptional regulator